MTIHQITFLYLDSEIAYAEGESVAWAFDEADDQFKYGPYAGMADTEDVTVVWVQFDDESDNHGGKRREMPYWDALTTLC